MKIQIDERKNISLFSIPLLSFPDRIHPVEIIIDGLGLYPVFGKCGLENGKWKYKKFIKCPNLFCFKDLGA